MPNKAILFDLDGTLISNSMETFLPAYFSALVKKIGMLVPADRFIAQLKASTGAMIRNNDPACTNAEIFAADFFPKIGLPREQLMPIFDDFYAREYGDLRIYIRPVPTAREVAAVIASKSPTVIRKAKRAFNTIDDDPTRSYRAEQGFTFELNLVGEGDKARDAFVRGER